MIRFIPILIFLVSCGNPSQEEAKGTNSNECAGYRKLRDQYGVKSKTKEYWHEGLKACVTESVPLTQFEKSERKRALTNVTCEPQYEFSSVSLVSQNNYYEYRNNRIHIHLDSSTGIFYRLILGQDKSGTVTYYSRDIGCWYFREDFETEPVNPKDYGKQILLDLELSASSSIFTPMEVFKIQSESPTTLELTRFDDNTGVGWTFCPTGTPYGYCNELRNGNIFYYPDSLSDSDKSNLQAEAILIRSEFNFEKTSEENFFSLWNYHLSNSVESSLGNQWEFLVQTYPDVPSYIHRAWRDYLRGERDFMPDTDSIKIPPICYTTAKRVTFEDGSRGFIKGEACYVDGEYIFTQY